MKVELVSVTPDAEKLIAYCARVSSPNQENPEYEKLMKYCVDNGHWSIFEQAHMTIEIITSRGLSPQILRHNSFRFQEFSQRYSAVDESGLEIYAARRQDIKNRQNSVDDLPDTVKEEWKLRQLNNWRTSFEHYKWALDNGIAKELARFVLPLGCATRMYMTGNVRSWIHYLQLRTGNGTQKEHMEIAEAIKNEFIKQFPTISRAINWR